MFVPEPLLIEKARLALLAMGQITHAALSAPLDHPYEKLRLAVFHGPEAAAEVNEARLRRRLQHHGRAYRVISDLSSHLGASEILLVEAAVLLPRLFY